MSMTPTTAEVLTEWLRAQRHTIRVAIPARVEAYNAAAQTVDVKPMVKDVLLDSEGNRFVETLPVLSDVPVLWPRGGGAFVSLPLQPGDFVQLLVNDRDVAGWRAGGRESEPDDLRTHDLTHAVAIPAGYPETAPLSSAHAANVVVGFDGGAQVHVKPNGEVHLSAENAADWVALAALTDARVAALEAKVNELVIIINALTLPVSGATAGPPAPPPATPITPGSSVAAAKVKAT